MATEIHLSPGLPDSQLAVESLVSQAERKVQDLERHLEAISKISVDFLALLSTSTVIATFGLFENSAAVIIGAMIIAPLMRPLTGLSLGLLTADLLLLKRAAVTLAIGTVLGAVIAFVLALVLQQIELTPEILARTKPTLLDLGIAFFAGGLGAYCQAKQQLADSLGGVAIAVALVPPLSVVGIGLALHEPELWQGAGLLYLTNLVGITIAGAVVFLAMGYAPLRRAKRGLLISVALLGLLTAPLALSMKEMIFENRLSGRVRQILQEKTYTFKDVRVRDVEIRKYRRPLVAIATVFTDQQIRANQVGMVQDFLIKELGLPLELRIKVVPLTEITARSPELPSAKTNLQAKGQVIEPAPLPLNRGLIKEDEDPNF